MLPSISKAPVTGIHISFIWMTKQLLKVARFGTSWLVVEADGARIPVPLIGIRSTGDRLVLPYPKSYVESGPALVDDQPLSDAQPVADSLARRGDDEGRFVAGDDGPAADVPAEQVPMPAAQADQLHVADGDTLHLVADQHGLHLTPYDPNFEAAMKAFEQTRRKYRNALRALAK